MARPTKDKQVIKHMFISDVHVPDHSRAIMQGIYDFIDDFIPDYLHIVGDFLNLTDASHYMSLEDHADLEGELRQGREILQELVRRTRRATKQTRIIFTEGNHEQRLRRFIASNARNLRDLTVNGEPALSLSALLGFKELGIEYVEYGRETQLHGNVIVEHGDIVRKHAGYSAKAMLESRHISGISGHTHRQSLIRQRYRDGIKFWAELGCLCNLEPIPHYVRNPNWQNGFMVAYYSPQTDILYPQLIPIEEETWMFNGKVYGGVAG